MGLNTYKPEGWKIDTPENRAAMASMTALMDACRDEKYWRAGRWFVTAPTICWWIWAA